LSAKAPGARAQRGILSAIAHGRILLAGAGKEFCQQDHTEESRQEEQGRNPVSKTTGGNPFSRGIMKNSVGSKGVL
jgi:hypothetical protein